MRPDCTSTRCCGKYLFQVYGFYKSFTFLKLGEKSETFLGRKIPLKKIRNGSDGVEKKNTKGSQE